ncbi:hypothetical protein A0257_19720 [Hymenobacter psoromatis]|nr:hypothetical protein A0257_19720 [Hymenobacter psoromatis]
MRFFSLLLIFLLPLLGIRTENDPASIREFIRDIIDGKLNNIEIGDKYFCTTVLHRTDKYGIEARSYLESTISEHRINLRRRQIKENNIILKHFNKLTEEEMPPKPFHMLSDTANVYVAQYQGKIVMFILLQDDQKKIASTMFINQGGEYYFLDFCH